MPDLGRSPGGVRHYRPGAGRCVRCEKHFVAYESRTIKSSAIADMTAQYCTS